PGWSRSKATSSIRTKLNDFSAWAVTSRLVAGVTPGAVGSTLLAGSGTSAQVSDRVPSPLWKVLSPCPAVAAASTVQLAGHEALLDERVAAGRVLGADVQ